LSLDEKTVSELADYLQQNGFTSKWTQAAHELNQKRKDEEARLEAERKEQGRLCSLEKEKPCNRFVHLWKYRNCSRMDTQRLHDYCSTHDLVELQEYHAELLTGQHRESFPPNTADAARLYLGEHINARVNALNPAYQSAAKLAVEKENIENRHAETKALLNETKSVHAETKNLIEKINVPTEKAVKAYSR
jgi:hypothetical protein